jgi:adenylate kinase family enzyme
VYAFARGGRAFADLEDRRMMIELFGPPGSGKTTFAHALAQRIQRRGCVAEVMLSYRPGAYRSAHDPGGVMYAASRVSSATANALAMTFHLRAHRQSFEVMAKLIALLPPRNPLWLVRYSQYILHLANTWRDCPPGSVSIFDQAFVQAVCSLALFNRAADHVSLVHALDIIPESDLAIRLDVPNALLKSRLAGRMECESFMERLFEADIRTNLRANEVIDRMNLLLRSRGRSIMSFRVVDELALEEALDRTEAEIMIKLGSTGRK